MSAPALSQTLGRLAALQGRPAPVAASRSRGGEPQVNALSFDIEEYFHAEVFAARIRAEDWPRLPARVVSSTERLLDLLDRARVTATFFVLGWVAERYPRLVRSIHEHGHELACHGHVHRPIAGMTPAELADDVRRAKAAVEDASGARIIGYRAPTFSIVRRSLWALDVLGENGFRYDSSIFPIVHDRYGIPRAPRFPFRLALRGGGELVEFPLTTVRILGMRLPVAGGGYLRLLPYPLVRRALRRVNRAEAQPAIVYLHPWELDPGQPRLAVGMPSRLRHYAGLAGTEEKLRRLLADFRFDTVARVLRGLGLLAADLT